MSKQSEKQLGGKTAVPQMGGNTSCQNRLCRSWVGIRLAKSVSATVGWEYVYGSRKYTCFPTWSPSDRSWAALGHSWPRLGRSWPLLGRSWPLLGCSWLLLGRSWPLLCGSWPLLGRPGAALQNSCDILGPLWGTLGLLYWVVPALSGFPLEFRG